MSRKPALSIAAAVVMLGGALTACSPATPEDNAAGACDAHAAFVGAVADARTSLDADSTVGEIREARDSVSSAYDELKAAVSDVEADRFAALTDAWVAYDRAAADLPDDSSIEEAAESLTDEVDGIDSAQQALDDQLDC